MTLMRTPRTIDLLITGKCNLRCKYCSYFSSGAEVDEDLPAEEWLRFFEELNRAMVMDVCFQGGEPFMRPDLPELIEGIVRNGMRFSILTNGTLITDDIAQFLKSTGRLNSIQVSIDGATAETHESCRGAGNFNRAVNGLKILQKHGLPSTVRVTIHRGNVRDLENVAKLLLEDFGLPSFSCNSASHFGLCRQNAEQVQLNSEERSLAMKSLLALSRKYNGRISATAGPLAEAQGWSEVERAREQGLEELSGCGFLTGCGGVFSQMAVLANGTMVACASLPDLALGRINRDDLVDIWQNHPELNRFRKRREIPLSSFEFCAGCPYIPYCTGNCPGTSYTITHDAWAPSPDACYRLFLEQGGKLPPFEDLPGSSRGGGCCDE
jgi:SynChlorMet cassette radical SAM/SPASM protein ScmE